MIVNLVVLKLDLFQSWAPVDQIANHYTSTGCHVVVRQIQAVKLLLSFALECVCHDTDTLVSDSIASEIELSDSLRALQDALQL